jgi:hypothetical protein
MSGFSSFIRAVAIPDRRSHGALMSARFDRSELTHARTHLEQLGYRIETRALTWFECRVSARDEDWIGRGASADEAFERVIGAMFPSRAASLALRDLLRAAASPAVLPDEPTCQFPLVSRCDDLSIDPPTREMPLPPVCIDADMTTLDAPSPQPTTEACYVLRELEQLRGAVLALEADLAVMAPKLQRLHLLAWAARVRALQDSTPASPAIEFAAGTVITLLQRMAQTFSPGSTTHLNRTASPQQCSDVLSTPAPPISWHEVAALAAQTIDELALQPGTDAHGWCAADRRSPAPANADVSLQRVAHTCARIERQLADATVPGVVDAELAASLADCAKTLRWLRGQVRDAVLWGKSVGSIRRVMSRNFAGLEPVARLLDPAYRPETTWAALAEASRAVAAGRCRAAEAKRVGSGAPEVA